MVGQVRSQKNAGRLLIWQVKRRQEGKGHQPKEEYQPKAHLESLKGHHNP